MVVRSGDVLFEVVAGRAVLVDPSGAELITLNPVGTLIWDALAQPADADSLTDRFQFEFEGVSSEQLRADIAAFLGELDGLSLLAEAAPAG